MQSFLEWVEQMHMGRPYGQMGPDGKIYGWSGGPLQKVPGTDTWRPSSVAKGSQFEPPPVPSLPNKSKQKDSEAEGLWKANSPLTRLGYLSGFPKAEELNLHNMDWNDLPPDAQQHAIRSMSTRNPFKETGDDSRISHIGQTKKSFYEMYKILEEWGGIGANWASHPLGHPGERDIDPPILTRHHAYLGEGDDPFHLEVYINDEAKSGKWDEVDATWECSSEVFVRGYVPDGSENPLSRPSASRDGTIFKNPGKELELLPEEVRNRALEWVNRAVKEEVMNLRNQILNPRRDY